MTTYLKVPCRHCGKNIEFDSEYRGEWIECPHCQLLTVLERKTIILPPAPQPSAPPMPEVDGDLVRGYVVVTSTSRGGGCIVQGLGMLCILAVPWFPWSTLIGVALLVAGGAAARTKSCSCSVCGNLVGSKRATICPACKALFT